MATLVKVQRAGVVHLHAHWHAAARQCGIQPPSIHADQIDDVDLESVRFWSEIVSRGSLTLEDTVHLFRGQTQADMRPNKDLFEIEPPHLHTMAHTVNTWNSIVREGVKPRWLESKPLRQTKRPANHRSINDHDVPIRRHLRKGQLEGRYLIVGVHLLDQWPEIFISPLAVVDKPGVVVGDIRLINNYSYPPDASVNDFTDRSDHPSISYNPPRAIARRIHRLRRSNATARVLIMLGDVAGAFRHIPVYAGAVHMFGFRYKDLLVIDLSCGFGWCGSPAYYAVAGELINYFYEFDSRATRRFTGNVWCDDHTCVEIDQRTRCFDANLSLRRAMATVLGPAALNEQKFTPWATKIKALGLLWDTEAGCVSIPPDKMSKAFDRVQNLISTSSTSKTELLQVLGSLRHVASCSRPARGFFQKLQLASNSARRFGSFPLSAEAMDDLRWFKAVLQRPDRFNSIPVAEFSDLAEPDIEVYMDASGDGLCVLEPLRKLFLRQRFSEVEVASLSINIRELRSAVLAVLHWGPTWLRAAHGGNTHVRFLIDNTTAVAWANRRSSRHPTAQLYNRLLSLAEFQYNLTCSASHIPGNLNVMADAGSRAWAETDSMTLKWSNLSASWTQVIIDPKFEDLSALWDRCCVATPWQALPLPNIDNTGVNGALSHG